MGKRKTRYAFEPDYAIPPGGTLQETIDTLGMTQRDLALRTGLAPKTINEIVKGKARLTHESAVVFERVTGVPARMWNNLEANYREQLTKIADRERLAADCKWLKHIPVRELVRRGAIPERGDPVQQLDAVLRFFGVSSVYQWEAVWMKPDGAFRRSARFEAKPGAVATWLRLGELKARQIETEPYDKAKFVEALGSIRELTTELPDVFQPAIVETARRAGVAVVFIPEIRNCPTSGVARWLTPTKALIQLSLRYKTDDQIWFSFFHEAGHVLNDPKKEVFIDDGDSDNEREIRANRFAADFLIPREFAQELPSLKSKTAIIEFSSRVRVAPGIVVGRLQKEEILLWPTPLNKLKSRFKWADS